MTFRRLGKHPKKYDRRTLQFARYLPKLPQPPVMIDRSSRLPSNIGMMGNDDYGDCTVAAAGHQIQSWSTYADRGTLTISDKEILAAYSIVSPNDQGAYLLDVLNLWRKTGVGGEKIEAFVELAMADVNQAKLAHQYFGGVYIGMSLPDTNTFGPWDVSSPTWRPNQGNGHAVVLLGYDDTKEMFKVATWGEVRDMSYDWFQKYCDEAYAVLDDLSLNAAGVSPSGFNFTALQNDLSHLGDPVVTPPNPEPQPEPPAPAPKPGCLGFLFKK